MSIKDEIKIHSPKIPIIVVCKVIAPLPILVFLCWDEETHRSAGARFCLESASSTPCISTSWADVSAGIAAAESYQGQTKR